MRRLGLAVVVLASGAGLSGQMAAASFDSYDSVDDLLDYLNSAEGREATGLKHAARDEQFTNRLTVVFEEGASLDARNRVLQDVGREFLAILFRRPGISTVTIIEKDAKGRILNRSVTHVAGLPGSRADSQPSPAAPMGAGD
jgi:hypothetical protein